MESRVKRRKKRKIKIKIEKSKKEKKMRVRKTTISSKNQRINLQEHFLFIYDLMSNSENAEN